MFFTELLVHKSSAYITFEIENENPIAHIKQWDIWSYVPCLSIELSRAIKAGFLFVQFWKDLPISLVTWKFKNPKPNKEESFNFFGEDDGNKEFPTAIMDPLSKLGFPEIPISKSPKRLIWYNLTTFHPPETHIIPQESKLGIDCNQQLVLAYWSWSTRHQLVELWRC